MYSDALIPFVKNWEGLKLESSRDPLVPGVWDVGYGHVLVGHTGGPVVITEYEAEALLRADLSTTSAEVQRLVGPLGLAQHEFDALVSFAFNLGSDKLGGSTLLRKLRSGDRDGAADEFTRWINAGGKPVPGLLKRRIAEAAMFTDADYSGKP